MTPRKGWKMSGLRLRWRRLQIDRERKKRAAELDCPGPGTNCICGNGIGCINVPYDRW